MISSIFWLGLFLLVYTYLGYPVVITLLSKLRENRNQFDSWDEENLPTVSLIIPAYNEADLIKEKIQNSLFLDYPKDKLRIVVIADGSTDATPSIVKGFDEVDLLFQPERQGKSAALNRAMKFIESDLVVFSDANTYLRSNTLLKLVQPFTHPEVAGVSGEKTVQVRDMDGTNAAGEGLYWKYESYLKRKDAEVHSIMGAAGELIALRTNCYRALDESTILDDFMLSLRLVEEGMRIAYVPEAKALERASASIKDELKRKVRIAAGGWQSMVWLASLLRFWKHPLITFMYVSHRVLRWSLSAFLLPVVFVLNAVLLSEGGYYPILFMAQMLFYGLALKGYLEKENPDKRMVFFVPYYFTMMNYAVWQGFVRFATQSQSAVWERAQRAV